MRYFIAVTGLIVALVAALALLWTTLPDVTHAADTFTPGVDVTNGPPRTLPACVVPVNRDSGPCAHFAPSMGGDHSYRIFRDGRIRIITDARAFHLLGDCNSTGPIYC